MSNSNSLPNLSDLGKKRISFAPVVRVPEGSFYPLRNTRNRPASFSAGRTHGRYNLSGPHENVPRANLWTTPEEKQSAINSYRADFRERSAADPEVLRNAQLKSYRKREHMRSVKNRLAGPRINGFFVPPPGWNVRAASGKTRKNVKKPSGVNRRSVKQKSRK